MRGGGGINSAFADELTDPYIPRIRSGEIKPPQYTNNRVSGPNPSVDEWVKSVESQDRGNIDGVVKWDKNKKGFKIKKVDQNGEPIEGVTFTAYNTKADAENNNNPISTATSDGNGNVKFTGLPQHYAFYIKETNIPKGYTISKEIISVYRDNGVRFIGEKKASDFKVAEAKEGQDLTKYLQSLIAYSYNDFDDEIDWLIFNDNGVEKLIPKKSLKRGVSWYEINKAGLVDGKKTTTVDGKTYNIRLMRAYSDDIDPNEYVENASAKGSEWNRMILPLIGVSGEELGDIDVYDLRKNPYGRFGKWSRRNIEKNTPALARYTWWEDFRGNGYTKSFSYRDAGVHRWMQNISKSQPSNRVYRGDFNANHGAAHLEDGDPYNGNKDKGWLPVLELKKPN